MIYAQTSIPTGVLSEETIEKTVAEGLEGRFKNEHVLVLIPDHTRTLPLPLLFRLLTQVLHDVRQLDFMIALGTHPPLSDEVINQLVGITAAERREHFDHVGLLNHAWSDPTALQTIGTITQEQVKHIAGEVWHPSLGGDVPVRINRHALECDHILIVGPTFPHEVVGFSGGAKYLFPGISGPEMINVTHWLGALITIMDMIGLAETPVRQMIHTAAECVPTPITLLSMVVEGKGLAGVFIGDHLDAWRASSELSSQRHIKWVERPFQRVLSWAPAMYDELWTGAKAMYKLEPAIADGGEVIVYAPHMDVVSHVHGHYIRQVGYHVRDYFLKQWDHFKDVPTGVLAHSTHLKGSGTFENGIEQSRIQVTLSSKIPSEECEVLNLGYMNPAEIDPEAWANREDEGILYVPKAGEHLYRLKESNPR